MKIRVQDGLPFISAIVNHRDQAITLDQVLIDTGSMGTIFSVDKLAEIGIELEMQDSLEQIRGVGGVEFVFTKRIDRIAADNLAVSDFEIEVGAMNYGFEIEGIVGMDFLTRTQAVVDLANLELYTTKRQDSLTEGREP
jgi:hypothetical protein